MTVLQPKQDEWMMLKAMRVLHSIPIGPWFQWLLSWNGYSKGEGRYIKYNKLDWSHNVSSNYMCQWHLCSLREWSARGEGWPSLELIQYGKIRNIIPKAPYDWISQRRPYEFLLFKISMTTLMLRGKWRDEDSFLSSTSLCVLSVQNHQIWYARHHNWGVSASRFASSAKEKGKFLKKADNPKIWVSKLEFSVWIYLYSRTPDEAQFNSISCNLPITPAQSPSPNNFRKKLAPTPDTNHQQTQSIHFQTAKEKQKKERWRKKRSHNQ